jgi:hypothetical protein
MTQYSRYCKKHNYWYYPPGCYMCREEKAASRQP